MRKTEENPSFVDRFPRDTMVFFHILELVSHRATKLMWFPIVGPSGWGCCDYALAMFQGNRRSVGLGLTIVNDYPLVNKLVDPGNHQFLEETNLPTPIYQGLC